jgi:hypothetical protein
LVIQDADRVELEPLTRSSSASAGLAQRARIVLLAGLGADAWIAVQVGVSVLKWRGRFARKGLASLSDEARSDRPRRVDRARVIATTLRPPPKWCGVTHWSTRLLGRHLGIGDATVAAIWREDAVVLCVDEKFQIQALDRTAPVLPTQPRIVTGLMSLPCDEGWRHAQEVRRGVQGSRGGGWFGITWMTTGR